MRNKEAFIKDAKKVLKPDILTDEQLIEDAAHTMRHVGKAVYEVDSQFTVSGKKEAFQFELKDRPATDNPEKMVEDYFYLGMGE